MPLWLVLSTKSSCNSASHYERLETHSVQRSTSPLVAPSKNLIAPVAGALTIALGHCCRSSHHRVAVVGVQTIEFL